MAAPLDLQEQEQLDELKHFWTRYGGIISAAVLVGLGAAAAVNGWRWYQREQSVKAAGLYEELDRAAGAQDVARAEQAFKDLSASYPGTTWAAQGGLRAAQAQTAASKPAQAQAALGWVAEHAKEAEYQWLARLRLAGLLLDAKDGDAALRRLEGSPPAEFAPLVADRRGDVLLSLGKRAEAVSAYREAWRGLAPQLDYRRLVEAKLVSLGVDPALATASAAASAPASTAPSAASQAPGASGGAR